MRTGIQIGAIAEMALQISEAAHVIDHPLGGTVAAQLAICLGIGFLIDEIQLGQLMDRMRGQLPFLLRRPSLSSWIETNTYCGPDRRRGDSIPLRGGRRASDLALVGPS